MEIESAAAAPNPYEAAASIADVKRLEIIFRPDNSEASTDLVEYLMTKAYIPSLDIIIPEYSIEGVFENTRRYNNISRTVYKQIRAKADNLSNPCRAVGDDEYKRSMLEKTNLILRSTGKKSLKVLTIAYINHEAKIITVFSTCSRIKGGGTSHMNIIKDILRELDYESIRLVSLPGAKGFYEKLGFDVTGYNTNNKELPKMSYTRKGRGGRRLRHTRRRLRK